jgi:anti-sigma B factor antagonist
MTSLEQPRSRDAERREGPGRALSMPDLRVEVRSGPEEATVAAFGEIDLASADQLQRPIVELLDSGSACVVVDLRGVSFIDSTGIHVLVAAQRRAQASGARLPVMLGGRATRRVLELTGLMGHFEIRDEA